MENPETNERSLPQLFHETHHALNQYLRYRRSERFGPEHGQGRLIELLRKTGPLTQKKLAYFLGIRQQSLGELVRKLEEAGYVERKPSPEDKRAMIVSLTDAGLALEIPHTNTDSVFDCLNEEERENLRSYLEAICERAAALMPEEARPGRCGCASHHHHHRRPEDAPHHHHPCRRGEHGPHMAYDGPGGTPCGSTRPF